LTGSRILALSAHAQQKNWLKIHEIAVQFPKLLDIGNLARRSQRKSRQRGSKLLTTQQVDIDATPSKCMFPLPLYSGHI